MVATITRDLTNMHRETVPGSGYYYVVDPARPHLGGNIVGGDPNCQHDLLWHYLVHGFLVKSVLDVGCGEGQAIQCFQALGCETLGIDGLIENTAKCPPLAICHDLTSGPVPYLTSKGYQKCFDYRKCFDLTWCCELVEHIEERYLTNLLDTLCHGNLIAMTHALPNQGGHHHVNCKSPIYWIGHMVNRGYRYLVDETRQARSLCAPNTFFHQSGLLFANRSGLHTKLRNQDNFILKNAQAAYERFRKQV